MTLGALGLLLGIAVLIVLCVRGINPFLSALIASLVIIVTNGLNLWDAIIQTWAGGMGGFVSTYLLFFCLAAAYGEMMKISGAAETIANALFKMFGPKWAPVATLIVTWILAYGGINVFIVVFAVYPIAMPLFRMCNITKDMMPGIFLFGSVVLLVCTPGVIAGLMYALSEGLGVPVLSASKMGVIAMLLSLAFGCVFFTLQARRLEKKGIGFEPSGTDLKEIEREDSGRELPPLWAALIPMVVTIVLKFVLLGNGWATMPTSYTTVVIGEVLMVILMWKYLKGKLLKSFTDGFFSGINPLMLNAAVMGFAAIINGCDSFQVFINFAQGLADKFNPYISAIITINIFSGITGASMSGAQIFANTMADTYLAYGVNNEALFKILSIASMGLDTLPHCPTFLAMAAVCGVTARKSYKYVFWVTVAFPIVLSLICVGLAMIGIV